MVHPRALAQFFVQSCDPVSIGWVINPILLIRGASIRFQNLEGRVVPAKFEHMRNTRGVAFCIVHCQSNGPTMRDDQIAKGIHLFTRYKADHQITAFWDVLVQAWEIRRNPRIHDTD